MPRQNKLERLSLAFFNSNLIFKISATSFLIKWPLLENIRLILNSQQGQGHRRSIYYDEKIFCYIDTFLIKIITQFNVLVYGRSKLSKHRSLGPYSLHFIFLLNYKWSQ